MSLTPTRSKVGPYQIGSLLGEGAMGRVYSGEKDDYGPVALKVSVDAEFESLLLSEAEALKKVSHPNIVPYVDWIEFDAGHALVMGYLDGESLEERFAQRPLSQDEIHTMATGIGDALATAHRAGVIHRDIKPSNLMLKQDGVPVLLDFGAAASVDIAQVDPVGTLSYMSPEQVVGDPASPASDQFSFGVVLYEAMAGRRPFSGYHAAALEYEICNEIPQPLHELDATISEPLSQVVERLMSKSAEDRFASMDAFVLQWEEARKARAGAAVQTRLVVVASAFDNETGEESVAFIGRALGDRVSHVLHEMDGVVVAARETVLAQEKAQADKLSAAAAVGAQYLASGRYMVLGDEMQITAEVIKVEDRQTLWMSQYRGPKAQLFEIQDQIAREIGTHFNLLVPVQTDHSPTKRKVNPEAYTLYQEARELYYRGGRENLERAIELYEEAIELDHRYSLALAGLADCYINMFMWRIDPRPIWLDRGEKSAQKAIDIDPDTAAAYRSLGRVSQHRRNFETALEQFHKAIEIDPKYAEAMCSLGWISSEAKDYDQALHWAAEANKASPGNPDAALLRGLTYLDQRNYANAERAFKELVRLHRDYSRGHLYLGESLQKSGRFEEAKKEYLTALDCPDYDPEAIRNLGRVQIYLNEFDDARDTFMRAIEDEAYEYAAHYYLGLVARLGGDVAGAQTSWKTAKTLAERQLKRDANDMYARLFLGLTLAAQGDRTAYDHIQEARNTEPKGNGEMALFEARVAHMLGDLDQAEACTFEATRLPLGPSHAEISADPHFSITWDAPPAK